MAAKAKTIYVCTACGAEYPRWAGKCAACGEWNTIEEDVRTVSKAATAARAATVTRIDAIDTQAETRHHTEIKELDRVRGGGIVPGGVVRGGGG